eukprot:TRINITY_DN733_c0_g1_i1.p1 TRINITY_DN733_c0_g1~~TRINITY_DN733_c0_g1_i1.p1  ORF type:complete len:263 (+),score=20.07 TRINITY_DN733_c0_g1_i1:99-887(+)
MMYYSDEESEHSVRTPCSVGIVECWADDYSSGNEEEFQRKMMDNVKTSYAAVGSNELGNSIPEPPSCCQVVSDAEDDRDDCCTLPFCLGVPVNDGAAPPEGCVGRNFCDGPHSFQQFKARDGHYKCGGCGTPVPTGTQMLGCQNCTFDICLKCMDDAPVDNTLADTPPAPSAPSITEQYFEPMEQQSAPYECYQPYGYAMEYPYVPVSTANPLMSLPLPTHPIQGGPVFNDYAIHPAPNTPPPPPTSYGHRRKSRRPRNGGD